ncbi:hypothetical protein [Adhaeretor mobilis]|nr:hypothetical protein [Adhaeretor mobilis]
MPRRLTVLTLVLAVILAGAWYKERENRRDWETQTAWNQKIERLTSDGLKHKEIMVAQVRSWWTKPNGLSKVESEWNDGEPLELTQMDDLQHATWIDPKYNIEHKFTFRDGIVIGHGTGWGPRSVLATYPRPANFSRSSEAESIREINLGCAIILWFHLFLASLATKDSRWLEEGAIITAITAGVAWLVDPIHSISWHGIFSNDNLVFALIMLVLSGVLLAIRRADAAVGWGFRFSLRGMLIAMTAVALLLALGPVGYVALAVASGAVLLGVLRFLQIRGATSHEPQVG